MDKKAIVYLIKDRKKVWFKKLKDRFSKNNKYDPTKIVFIDPLNYEDYLLHIGKASVLLDPIYYGAGNSFFESMLFGTPTITLPTDHIKSRLVLGAYKQMEIDNAPVAKDLHEYVELSIEIANNGGLDLKKYYQEQANKNLFENEKAVKDLESIFFNINNN